MPSFNFLCYSFNDCPDPPLIEGFTYSSATGLFIDVSAFNFYEKKGKAGPSIEQKGGDECRPQARL